MKRSKTFPQPSDVVPPSELPSAGIETAHLFKTEMPVDVDTGGCDVGVGMGDGGDADIKLLYTLLAQKVFEPCVKHFCQSLTMMPGVDIDRGFGAVLECGALVQGMGIGIGHRLSGGIVDRYKIRVVYTDVCDAAGKFLRVGGGIFKRNRRVGDVGGIDAAQYWGILRFGTAYGIRHVLLAIVLVMCAKSGTSFTV